MNWITQSYCNLAINPIRWHSCNRTEWVSSVALYLLFPMPFVLVLIKPWFIDHLSAPPHLVVLGILLVVSSGCSSAGWTVGCFISGFPRPLVLIYEKIKNIWSPNLWSSEKGRLCFINKIWCSITVLHLNLVDICLWGATRDIIHN